MFLSLFFAVRPGRAGARAWRFLRPQEAVGAGQGVQQEAGKVLQFPPSQPEGLGILLPLPPLGGAVQAQGNPFPCPLSVHGGGLHPAGPEGKGDLSFRPSGPDGELPPGTALHADRRGLHVLSYAQDEFGRAGPEPAPRFRREDLHLGSPSLHPEGNPLFRKIPPAVHGPEGEGVGPGLEKGLAFESLHPPVEGREGSPVHPDLHPLHASIVGSPGQEIHHRLGEGFLVQGRLDLQAGGGVVARDEEVQDPRIVQLVRVPRLPAGIGGDP